MSAQVREKLADSIDRIAAIGKGLRTNQLEDIPHVPSISTQNVVVEKCSDARPDLMGCNNAELMEASAGTLSCPPLEKATDPLIVDQAGRICYARKDLLEAWKEADVDKDGNVLYDMKEVKGRMVRVPRMRNKTLNIDDLTDQYANQLLKWLANNKNLQIALATSLDSSNTMPPIILNYYRSNPYIVGFCENLSKKEYRFNTSSATPKRFRGLKQFGIDNSFNAFKTRNEFATLVTSFTSALDSDSGAKFMSVFINPLAPGQNELRGMFDIYAPPATGRKLDFLEIGARDRHSTQQECLHAVHCNVTELIFTAIATLYRDSVRYPKLKKFVNSLGDLLQFGELAPEVESPENKCRQAGVCAANATAFLPRALKDWLANLPSTWRHPGPEFKENGQLDENHPMQQRVPGTIVPVVSGSTSERYKEQNATRRVLGQSAVLNSASLGSQLFQSSGVAEELKNVLGDDMLKGTFAVRSPSGIASPSEALLREERRQSGGSNPNAGEGASLTLSSLLSPSSAANRTLPFSGSLAGGEALAAAPTAPVDAVAEVTPELAGGVAYENLYTGVNSVSFGYRANPPTVPDPVVDGANIDDPRIIMQNFISLCFYLNWVEMYGHSSSDDSVLGLFKSLRVSYDNMIKARMTLEDLLKFKATEKTTVVVSAVTDKHVDDALNNKRGADASYLGVSVRIAKKIAKLLDIGWENCESSTKLQEESKDPANNGWHDKCLPHQKLFRINGLPPKFTVNQIPGIADNRVSSESVSNKQYTVDAKDGIDEQPGQRGMSLKTSSWNIRDYDFVATSRKVRDWVSQRSNAGGLTADVQLGDPVKYTYQYNETANTVTTFGINTVEFRKAWKNSYQTYEGIKNRKNYMNKVGYEQMQSRIMDFHLTFAQSSEYGRQYFVKMFKYSKATNFRKDGITEDPRSITREMFEDDNSGILEDLKSSVRKTAELMKPLSAKDVCKVVLGDAQYFIYKTNSESSIPLEELNDYAESVYEQVSKTRPTWWANLVTVGKIEAEAYQAGLADPFQVVGSQGPVNIAQGIIENDITYEVATRRDVSEGAKTLKYFGSCEPMDMTDYNMYSRRKKMLELVERPEDELFFLGVEWIAKLYSRKRLGAEAEPRTNGASNSPQYTSSDTLQGQRVALALTNTGVYATEDVPFAYSKQDTERREGSGGNQSLTANERDAYARYIILMYKISGGNPGKLANKVLNMVDADSTDVSDAQGRLQPPFNSAALRLTPVNQYWNSLALPAPKHEEFPAIDIEDSRIKLSRKAYIAMQMVLLASGYPPLFATVGQLSGGTMEVAESENTEPKLEGGEQPVVQEVDSMNDIDSVMDDLLNGGALKVKSANVTKSPVRQSAAANYASGPDDRTADERALDDELVSLGYDPVIRIKVSDKGPKLLNGFGSAGQNFVASDKPWIKCQKELGVSYFSKQGGKIKWWYNDKDKCYRPADASSEARSTYEKLESFQNLARLINNATQSERNAEMDKARMVILADAENNDLTHEEVEQKAAELLPGYLQALPTNMALKTASWVSEDVVSQINEITDSTEQEERARLTKLIRDNSLMSEEWKAEDALVELSHLKELVEDMVKQAQICTIVSESIKDNATSTELRSRMAQAVGIGGTLDTQFVEGLSPKAKLYLQNENFASKCDVQNLGVNKAVLIPAAIKNRIDEDALTKGEEKALNPIVQWWRQAYSRTAVQEREQAEKLERLIDPHKLDNSTRLGEIGLKKETYKDKIERSVDSSALGLLPRF